MPLNWDDIRARGERGEGISDDEARAILALATPAELDALWATAQAVRHEHKGNFVNTCGIV